MSTHFVIQGVKYSEEELIQVSWDKDGLQYVADIRDFVLQWRNHSDIITAHTSGSTGVPKNISLSKWAMKASAKATGKAFGFIDSVAKRNFVAGTICSPLSARYIAGMMMIVRALEWGVDLLCTRPSSTPIQYVDRQVDFMVMTPHQLSMTIDAGLEARLEDVRYLLLGGSPLSKFLENEIRGLASSVYVGYGMTETMSHVALRQLSGDSPTEDYHAVAGVEFTIDNRSCLIIHAEQLRITALVTNDVVELKDRHTFTWLGRYDHVVNSGGIKLFPETIERKIADIIDRPYFISSVKDRVLGEKLVIFLEGAQPDVALISTWKSQIAEILEKYEMPKEWIIRDAFEYTENGKIKRK